MIEKLYAAHLKTTIDASAINVRRPVMLARRNGHDAAPVREAQVQAIAANGAAS